MNYKCYFCHANTFRDLLDRFEVEEEKRPLLVKDFFSYINNIDMSVTAPEVARNVHSKLKEYLNDSDPYKKEKHTSNQGMMKLASTLRASINKSDNPFNTALRLAVGGNIIDYGPSQSFDVKKTLKKVLKKPLGIDHSESLRAKIKSAKNMLYLGDNTGEIVLDRLFLETIKHPNVTYVVREKPILNDATMEDALEVGIDKLARVISNGDDAPSTLLHRTSKEFNNYFQRADLIISKGMGNLEGLINTNRQNLFFLLIAKCEHIGNLLGVKNGDFIVKEHEYRVKS